MLRACGSYLLVAGRIRRRGADNEQNRERKKKAMHGFSLASASLPQKPRRRSFIPS